MKKLAFIFVGLVVGFGIVEVARSEVTPTAFTYQGRLNVQGDAAAGSYDFTFLLYDSLEKGRQIGEPVFCGEVEVTDGYFSVELDFGPDPSVFNGLTRYLEISVQRTGLEAPAVLLSPRQKVSATPNARRAFSAQEIRPLKHIGDYVVRMDIEGMSSQYFHHFNWLKSETQIILYRDGTGNTVMKIPGQSTVADLELTRFVSENSFLREWLNVVLEGGMSKREVAIYLLNRQGYAVDAWRLNNAWPSKLYYETDDSFATVVEKTVLVAEQIDRIAIDPGGQEPDPWYPGQQPVVRLPLLLEVSEDQMREYDEMTGLGWQVQVIEYRTGEDLIIQKIPGEQTVMNLKLAREVVNSDERMWEWRKDLISGTVSKKDVLVIMNDQQLFAVLAFGLPNSWPAELGTSYDPAKNRMEEALVIAADHLY